VHGARFRRKDIILRGHRLTIPFNRDCWEIPITANNELHIADSKFMFATVQDLKWTFEDVDESDPNHELCIEGLCVNETFRSQDSDRFNFVICGYSWQLRFTLEKYAFTVRLQDLEMPYLYSKRGASESFQPAS
jgi:hypothetical protein